jgi:phosphoribosylglycinamide formyltransferase-1
VTETGDDSRLSRLREIAAGFPEAEVTTKTGGQHWAFEVRGKNFAYWLNDHHSDGRIALQCKLPPGELERLVGHEPATFYVPPYMARFGWVGIYLDAGPIDWPEIEGMMALAYRLTAPKKLLAGLD